VIQSPPFKGGFFLRAEKHRLFAAVCLMTGMACVYASGLAASASDFDADGWMRTPNSTNAEDWTERYNVTSQLANGGFSTDTNVSSEESGKLFWQRTSFNSPATAPCSAMGKERSARLYTPFDRDGGWCLYKILAVICGLTGALSGILHEVEI
jgi:hypothetical protein